MILSPPPPPHALKANNTFRIASATKSAEEQEQEQEQEHSSEVVIQFSKRSVANEQAHMLKFTTQNRERA